MNETFPVQDSVLSARAIGERLLPSYGLATPYDCRLFRKGICDTYRLDTGSGRFYMKAYKTGRRSPKDVSEEVRLLLHLRANGISVVEPVARRDGGFVNELAAPEGIRCCVLFRAAEGVGEDTDDHRRAFGAMVARMHLAADSLTPEYDRQHLDMSTWLGEHMAPIASLMAHRHNDYELIEGIAGHAVERIESLLPKTPPEYGICHGDLHGGDVVYGPDGSPTLLDFDSSGPGWRAMDLGVYLCHDWMNTSDDSERERRRRMEAFLGGYETIRTLGEDEHTVIGLTPAIRHIFLMGHVLRYNTVYEGWNWADDGFIDWHMEWFRHWWKHKVKE